MTKMPWWAGGDRPAPAWWETPEGRKNVLDQTMAAGNAMGDTAAYEEFVASFDHENDVNDCGCRWCRVIHGQV